MTKQRLISSALLAVAIVCPQFAHAQGAGAEWTTPAGTVQGTRFSTLNPINTSNVARLTEEFHFTTGIEAGHEGARRGRNHDEIVTPFPTG
jgi:lanthanide-dependent methanol dehydrogenase